MKILHRLVLLIPFVALLLGGCVVLDVTTLDTAVPLPAGKVKFGVYTGIGPDLATYITPESSESEPNASSWFLSGVNAGVGIDGKNELGLRGWVYGDYGAGVRLGWKHVLKADKASYTALVPALNVMWDKNEDEPSTIESSGAELQWLYTQVLSENLAMTAALRGNVSYLTGGFEDMSEDYYPPYFLWEGGIRFNFEASGSPHIPIYVIPEFGVDLIQVVNGKLTPRLIIGILIGFKP